MALTGARCLALHLGSTQRPRSAHTMLGNPGKGRLRGGSGGVTNEPSTALKGVAILIGLAAGYLVGYVAMETVDHVRAPGCQARSLGAGGQCGHWTLFNKFFQLICAMCLVAQSSVCATGSSQMYSSARVALQPGERWLLQPSGKQPARTCAAARLNGHGRQHGCADHACNHAPPPPLQARWPRLKGSQTLLLAIRYTLC